MVGAASRGYRYALPSVIINATLSRASLGSNTFLLLKLMVSLKGSNDDYVVVELFSPLIVPTANGSKNICKKSNNNDYC